MAGVRMSEYFVSQSEPQADPLQQLRALALVTVAIALGIAAQGLLYGVEPGVNILLVTWIGAAITYGLDRRQCLDGRAMRWWAIATVTGLFSLVALRDADELRALAIVAGLGVAALALVSSKFWSSPHAAIEVLALRMPFDGLCAVVSTAGGIAHDLAPLLRKEAGTATSASRIQHTLRGLAIAVPFVVGFGAILANSDQAFGEFTARFAIPRLDAFVVRVVLAALVAGALLIAWRGRQTNDWGLSIAAPRLLAPLESTIAMAAIDALFVTFLATQLQYFFGDDALVQAEGGPTYAAYARRGFFELLFVVASATGVLYGFARLTKTAAIAREAGFQWAGRIMVASLAVMAASALHRLSLYIGAYGLTLDRLYAGILVVLVLLGMALGMATVLRGRDGAFAKGLVVLAVAAVVAIHLLNPHAFVAAYNLERAFAGKRSDVVHMGYLGVDAVPVVVDALARANASDSAEARVVRDACIAALLQWEAQLAARFGDAADMDWRAWNYGVARAGGRLRETALDIGGIRDEGIRQFVESGWRQPRP